ncbi:MAG: photosynthetic reaction center subunit H [Gemmatimonadaceae bacterium]|nr:photosynthetic reaction center subunit H [Acetobacteraceae bacterium]
MQTGALTSYVDVAQITLYVFWIFFAGLIVYLCRENKREGYTSDKFINVPPPKAFVLADGSTAYAPRFEKPEVVNAVPMEKWEGSARVPVGNPMLAAIGPGAYAQHRPDYPDHTFDDGLAKIVPLRTLPDFWLANEDPNPHGMTVYGADRILAGKVVDSWIDRSEVVIRYFEVELVDGDRVLLPQHYAQINKKTRQIRVSSILTEHFATVPRLKNPETVTLLEEEKLVAYYAGGLMYATPTRAEPLV